MASLLDLERWCNVLPGQIETAASKQAQNVTLAMANDLVETTPVDVTTAVSNWQASINAPAAFDLPAIFPGDHGSTAPQSRQAAKDHINAVVKTKDPGEAIYLSNLTPYILDLNAGSSRQAAPNFIDRGFRVGELYGASVPLGIGK